ncbi:acetoin dehydrogenase dihydrolipoyllysine-residue acetyltransferase subunit [Veronia pacifica]|uniref:Acetoin dehydrogenase dihydrolipoyllysine-residue acetyltransferase subunit n=1 Tax=Veronia pacifica TaxID=1080227 RepID=A0A1C3ECU7_9GAMM|nr:acetoin dehydrogenase dihydrolipoyllysine-residue acetyltransferase subunit [Veronia pacifica]ODA31014.1 acetoin dehydrogenase dihydrolipoyllysine-residue acetyltransferase subunit [Veronia pacifica]
MSKDIIAVVMPKWGLSMQEGTLTEWHVSEGDVIDVGQSIMDVETDKIASEVEAPDAGLIRRIIGEEGEVYPIQALLAVLAPEEVSDKDIDTFIANYETPAIDNDDEETQAATYQFAETSQGKIRYSYRPAEGVPIVLVHGFGGDIDNWLFNIDSLNELGPVLAIDLPGHGQSDKPGNVLTYRSLTNALSELMDTLSIDAAHMVGHSMGGLVISQLALDVPSKVLSLSVIAGAGLGPEINTDYIDGFIHAESRRDLKPVLQQLFADSVLVTRTLVDDVLKYKRLDKVGEGLSTLRDQLFVDGKQKQQLAAAISEKGIRTLVIWGEKDEVIPASHATILSHAEHHVLTNVGHMVQMEAAAEVNTLLQDFIRG